MIEVSEARLASLPPAQREQVERAIAELAVQRETAPQHFIHVCSTDCGIPGCRPYPQQAEFLAATEFWKAFFGGNGAGKSQIGIIDNIIQLVDEDCLPERLRQYKRWRPPFFMRIVVPKVGVIDSMLQKFREMCPKDQFRDGSIDKAYFKRDQKLWFANGSWVLFNTADQDVDAHASVALHRVHFDEEPEGAHGRKIYQENLFRLRQYSPKVQVMFTMTPLFGMSWTYDELWERRDDEDVYCVTASLLDNPWIDGASLVEKAKASMSKEELAARVEGRFVHFHGSVINVTDEHKVDPPSREHVMQLSNYVGIDPGMERGGVVWVGFDRDNDALVYDELYPSGQTPDSVALDIMVQNARWGLGNERERRSAVALIRERLEDRLLTPDAASSLIAVLRSCPPGPQPMYIIDPSARNRQLTDAQKVEGEFQRVGIFTVHGQNDRRAGVMQLRSRLEHKGLLVSRECANWLKEAQRWLVDRNEVTDEQRSNTGSPDTFATKGPDHLMDPTRYVVMERLWVQSPKPWRMATVFDGHRIVDPRVGMFEVGDRQQADTGPLGSMA